MYTVFQHLIKVAACIYNSYSLSTPIWYGGATLSYSWCKQHCIITSRSCSHQKG